ncbi:MAG: glycosyltransferase family A protein [Lutibacter sp.]|uniref:glycosyltransferase family A protein n=1 Tax=Lutibacter sp. TaxID=1925666 RepID=UPI00385F225C
MRVGVNPEKKNKKISINSYHRVIIPVYIPNLEEDYFKDGLQILKYNIESLLATIHVKTRVSIVNNNCCSEVTTYLEKKYAENTCIDQLLNSKINLGKVNAINAVVKGNLEPLITITDADVLFAQGWQHEVEKVFLEFPNAGMVSPVPSSIGYRGAFLNSTYFYGFFKGLFKFSNVENPEGMLKFEQSIGRKMYNTAHLQKYLTIENKNKFNAVVGCGHFVATVKSDIFRKAPNCPSKFKIVGGSESDYIDSPNDNSGYLRLATTNNLAYHLGNKVEKWMTVLFNEIISNKNENQFNEKVIKIKSKKISKYGQIIGKMLYVVFIKIKKVRKIYFQLLGLKVNNY